MVEIVRKIGGFLVLWIICIGILPQNSFGNAPLNLKKGWEYRWGDSTFDKKGIPVWTYQKSAKDWKSIKFPSNPPKRNGRNNVWYRVTLPEGSWRDPTLFIFSIDLIAEVYLDQKKIYQYGTFDKNGKGKFVGWPWHMLELPKKFSGKTLYFRVYSDYPDIGLWGQVIIASRYEHVLKMFGDDWDRIFISMLLFFLAIGSLVFFLVRRQGTEKLYLSVFMFSQGIVIFCQTQVRLLVWYEPIPYMYIRAGAYFLLPVFLGLFIQKILGKGFFRLLQWTWVAHFLFFLGAMIFPLMGWVNLSSTYVGFDAILLVSICIFTFHAAIGMYRKQMNAKPLFISFLIMGGFIVYDMLTAHAILNWTPQLWHLGSLLFAISLVFIPVQNFMQVHNQLQIYSVELEEKSKELEALNSSLEEKVTQRTKELTESNHQKDRLFSIIAHDLRSPFNGLLGWSQIMYEDFEELSKKETKECVNRIYNSAKHLYQLLDNLLDWARLQMDRYYFEPRFFYVHPVIDTCIQVFSENAEHKKIIVKNNVDGKAKMFADSVMVATILRNFLSNAIKFTPKEGTITFEAKMVDNHIHILVKDTGVGISSEKVKLLFQIDESHTTNGTENEKGTGLGLLLCKDLIEKNKGEILVESEENKGTTFALQFQAEAFIKQPFFSTEN
ncbi:MAG: signal transduction histidine kinase [bacterium]|jgi:signal transduction histidine kinase